MLSLLLTCVGLMPQGPGTSTAPVVINEFLYWDGPTEDDHEFVELYNRSILPVSIGDWQLLSRTVNSIHNHTWTIPSGQVLLPGEFYVMGGAVVPDPKQALTTYWATMPTNVNLFHNNQGALIIMDSTGAVVDSVYHETFQGLWPGAAPEGEGIWGRNLASDVFPTSWQRAVDGLDTDNNGNDFVLLPWSPGTTNTPTGPFPYFENYDDQLVEVLQADWGRSVEFVYVIDPTQVSTHNLNQIVPSPQGGNAITFWPNSGANMGQNNMLLSSLQGNVVFEGWCYFDATPETSGHETWSIGFGATGTAFQPPDPSGALGVPSNNENQGGVSWTYQVTSVGATLYMIDHNDGGWAQPQNPPKTPATVVGQITITPGVNDGWQKLRLERSNGMFLGSFGGSLGCADGQSFWCPASHMNATTLYVGYRESIPDNNRVRPPTLDDVLVKTATSLVQKYGTAAATTAGTPMLSALGPPSVGNPSWGIGMAGLVPSQNAVLLLGSGRQTPPFDLSAIGGQPGAFLHVVPLFPLSIAANAQGNATLPIRIPCRLLAIGSSVYWQVLDPDPALGFPLPLGTSAGLQTRFGL